MQTNSAKNCAQDKRLNKKKYEAADFERKILVRCNNAITIIEMRV